MNDRPPLNEAEAEARRQLVAIAHAMHSGEFSFIDGAVQVLHLKAQVGGVGDHDVDFNAFVIIQSETDQLPLEAQRHLWASEALNRLEPEFSIILCSRIMHKTHCPFQPWLTLHSVRSLPRAPYLHAKWP